jgi:hypothetical protein
MTTSTIRLTSLERKLRPPAPAERFIAEQPLNIIHFAASDRYLNKSLFPRQATALKVFTLAEELLTDYDLDVIAEWEAGFVRTGDRDDAAWSGSCGTTGDLMERLRWNRAQNRKWFPQIELLLGRRGSKNFLVSVLMAWVLWHLISGEDPHERYGIDPLKRLSGLVFAGKKDAAVRNQVRDLVQMICTSPAFEPFHPIASSDGVVLFTPKQIAAGVDVTDRNKALVEIRAAETTLAGPRGPATFMLGFDEFAFVQGAGSTVTSTELFEAAYPGTAQFGGDAPIIQTTSPWDQQGQAWQTYKLAMAINTTTGEPMYPDTLVLQLPSTALYKDHDIAEMIAMWPGGPCFEGGRSPIIRNDKVLEAKKAANPEAFAVEFDAQWRQSQFAYLTLGFIDRLFAPYKGTRLVMNHQGALGTVYMAHGDPSLSQANFGFAVAHLEYDDDGIPHVVFDLIRHWTPSDFPDGIVDYIAIESEILSYIQAYNLHTLTFDQWNSAGTIQHLRSNAEQLPLARRPIIEERFATKDRNLRVYEIFKTAIGHGIVHAPEYPLARDELRGLQYVKGRIEHAEAGDTRTKDVADAMAHTVYNLIGEDATAIFERLATFPLGATNFPPPSLSPADPDQDVFRKLGGLGRSRGFGGGAPRGGPRGSGPRRGAGRPNFGHRPNDPPGRGGWGR